MKTYILLFCLLTTSVFCSVANTGPSDYKKRIEWTLAKKNPQYREFYCEYFGPAKATIGEDKKVVYVVCCDWGGKLKSGALPLMITRQIFVFDDQVLSEATENKVRWLDENPIPVKKRSNKAAQTTPGLRPSVSDL